MLASSRRQADRQASSRRQSEKLPVRKPQGGRQAATGSRQAAAGWEAQPRRQPQVSRQGGRQPYAGRHEGRQAAADGQVGRQASAFKHWQKSAEGRQPQEASSNQVDAGR